jgi:hypothetical protein
MRLLAFVTGPESGRIARGMSYWGTVQTQSFSGTQPKEGTRPRLGHHRSNRPSCRAAVRHGCTDHSAGHGPAGLDAPLTGLGTPLAAGHVITLQAGLGAGLAGVGTEAAHFW